MKNFLNIINNIQTKLFIYPISFLIKQYRNCPIYILRYEKGHPNPPDKPITRRRLINIINSLPFRLQVANELLYLLLSEEQKTYYSGKTIIITFHMNLNKFFLIRLFSYARGGGYAFAYQQDFSKKN